MKADVYIQNGNTVFQPAVLSGMQWDTVRRGEPSTLKFTVVRDAMLNITEGNRVELHVDGVLCFVGYIFKLERSKTNELKVTAYDQLRYFKNKDSYIYTNKRADEVLSMVALDFGFNLGAVENTGYTIPSRAQDNKTLFDIVYDAMDLTLVNNGTLYVLYDNCGAICLRDASTMLINTLIDETTAQNFSYSSSINDRTYNQIKIAYDNEQTGKREIYIAKDSSTINAWGVLQYYEKVQSGSGKEGKKETKTKEVSEGEIKKKLDALLKLYNAKTKSLKISGAFGDVKARAGFSLPVILDLGDMVVKNNMLIEKATHKFEYDLHTMDLTLRGGDITG